MTIEGLQYWIEAQIQALNPESFLGQLGVFVAVIGGSLLIAALVRQFSKALPLSRGAPQMPQFSKPEVIPQRAILKSTTGAEFAYRQQATALALSTRQKKKAIRHKPKKYYLTIEKAPSDPMFLPPYDTTVPYRDRLAMIGNHKAP